MRALIIVESCFGNTATAGEAIAAGLREAGIDSTLLSADNASPAVAAELIIVGAPTHNLGLPSPTTRGQAAGRGAQPSTSGVREWLGSLESIEGAVFAFATTTASRLSGSAASTIIRNLKRRGVRAQRGPDFTVRDVTGPLADGELDRARDWGRSIGQAIQNS